MVDLKRSSRTFFAPVTEDFCLYEEPYTGEAVNLRFITANSGLACYRGNPEGGFSVKNNDILY